MGWEGLTIEELERDLKDMQDHCRTAEEHKAKLEAILKRRKHAHSTLDGIDEAIGLCASILHDEDLASVLREQKFRRLREVLNKVRQSPTAYRDEDVRTLPGLREWLDDFEEFREERQRARRG